jgi:hypothetical protein
MDYGTVRVVWDGCVFQRERDCSIVLIFPFIMITPIIYI